MSTTVHYQICNVQCDSRGAVILRGVEGYLKRGTKHS